MHKNKFKDVQKGKYLDTYTFIQKYWSHFFKNNKTRKSFKEKGEKLFWNLFTKVQRKACAIK